MLAKRIPQEGLKLIACLTMLLDHIGAVVVMGLFTRNPSRELLALYETLRLIGRLAFPIYCFLLSEGSFHTRNPRSYGIRLAVCALLSELPYDLGLWGGVSWAHQNVMVTLLLAFCGLEVMKKCPSLLWKFLSAVPFAVVAELAGADYGWTGVMLVVLFSLTRDMPHKLPAQFFGMWFLFSPGHAMMLNWIGRFAVTIQEWAVVALIPISLYSGRKLTDSRAVQWGFYLFYPVHLLILWFLR